MKKYLILFALSFASSSYGNLVDDWSNDDLCGWMESTATPEYIQAEVLKREIICYGGIEVSSLPSAEDYSSQNGTVFPSPDPSLIPVITDDKDKSYSY
ncbi:transposase [Candidatus Pseudothioglobus singularis]|nr:transposase [Candidatus Pseudothioglobus singularis]MDC3216530.1 transposase [Candidatus Pseudothioglobus singularis]